MGRILRPLQDNENTMKKFMAMYMAPVAEMEKLMKNSTKEDQEKG